MHMNTPGSIATDICGTLEYLAPEVYIGNGYGLKQDFWSFGCLIYEMLVGIPPFFNNDRDQLFISIVKKDPKFHDFIPKAAKDLMS